MGAQFILQNGIPEWAILPYKDYLQLVEQAEMLEDIMDYDRIKAAVENGEEEVIPSEEVYLSIDTPCSQDLPDGD
jgi:hypothetical protein